jgi:hypothetical protein
LIDAREVRSLPLKRLLVYICGTTRCFPDDVIEQFGLKVLNKVDVATVIGLSRAKIFQDSKTSLHGRHETFECLGFLMGCDATLERRFLLKILGWSQICKGMTLRALRSEAVDTYTYLTIL